MLFLYMVLGLLGLFLAVILIRAACFNPKKQPAGDGEAVAFDKDASVEALAQLVKDRIQAAIDEHM